MFETQPDEDNKDEWINTAIWLHIKDNTPYIEGRRHTQSKQKCEFCGRTHTMRDDICDIKTKKCKSGNSWEDGCRKITLGDLYSMLSSKRNIRLEVMINTAAKPDFKYFTSGATLHPSCENTGAGGQKGAISLESCFKAFSTEELLSGND